MYMHAVYIYIFMYMLVSKLLLFVGGHLPWVYIHIFTNVYKSEYMQYT